MLTGSVTAPTPRYVFLLPSLPSASRSRQVVTPSLPWEPILRCANKSGQDSMARSCYTPASPPCSCRQPNLLETNCDSPLIKPGRQFCTPDKSCLQSYMFIILIINMEHFSLFSFYCDFSLRFQKRMNASLCFKQSS